MSDEVLIDVPREQVPQVLSEMKMEWPHSMVAYNILNNAYIWERKEPDKSYQLLRPSSSNLKGIFVILITYHTYKISLWAMRGMDAAMEDLLMRTRRIDWNADEVLFAGINTTLQPVLLRVLQKKGIAPSFVEHCTAYWMLAQHAAILQPECPEGMYFGLLNETHAELINSRWTYGTSRTLKLVQDILRLNPCWGLFVSASGQLAAWCLTAEYGVGMLRTDDQHRRRGYARVVAKKLFQQLGQEGIDIHLHVENNNAVAHCIFQQLGCLDMGEVFWTGLEAHQ